MNPSAIAAASSVTCAEAPWVRRSDESGISTLTLMRPERANPLSRPMIDALGAALAAIAADRSIRVVVLAATGRAFCAGHDLRELKAHRGDQAWLRALFDDCSALMLAITRMPQPVIACVQGIATAAGCQLVSMCDLAVASSEARFALPGVNVGIFCTTPAVGVARSIVRKQVLEMLLTGDAIDAQAALDRGLVNRVVAPEALEPEVRRLAAQIGARSSALVAAGKRAFYRQVEMSLEEAYDLASGEMVSALALDDAGEGIDAFLGKRAPTWSHG
jgi:enoyl-CoA hydratase/carnithine racemase